MSKRAVIIELKTMIVDNVTIVGRDAPDQPDGFRLIDESEWQGEQDPRIGMVWDGNLPASFSEPEVPEGSPDNMEIHELLNRQKELAEEQTRIAEIIAGKLSG